MKQTKTILFLTRLYHPYIGGVEKHVKEISYELRKMGYKIKIITESNNSKLKTHEFLDGVEVFRIKVKKDGFTKKFVIWKWLFENYTVLKDSDVIHIHDVFYWILPFRFFIPKRKLFITFHGYEGYPIRWRWIVQRKVAEKLSNGSICIGDFMKKWYKAKPDFISYGGVRIKKIVKKTPKPQSAVFFGRLDEQTGIETYVSAYKKIKEKYPNFKLTVVGDGKLEKILPKDVIRESFTTNIEQYIYSNRFIFVSRYLSMLEALAAYREVIAVYDNPVKQDYLKMSPFSKYVKLARSGDDISHIVEKSLKTKVSKRILEGHNWVKSQTWGKMTEMYLRLWGINKA